ncbi:NAD-dependent epimerase/dehydratase family protein [Shewanella scandinavica]|uniref:NAD-dependent epimerase/dehydratase family protein n=1 Tax=Shewanella scandinavica TaxID=3063538 RepID=UPI003186EF1D
MSILLTGASGFIGKQLIQSPLVSKLVVRDRSFHVENKSVFFLDGLSENTNWQAAFSDCDVKRIIHLGGLAHSNFFSQEEYQSVNVDATLHLANEAVKAGVKRFVFVSSIGVNGASTINKPYAFNSNPNPHNHYTRSKYDAEVGLLNIAHETGLEVVIIRPTLVYGPNAPGNFGALINLVKNSPFLPFGLSTNKRDFIAVQNLADLLVTCATHPNAAGHTFLASDMETVSIKQFTNAIADGLGKKVLQLPIPISLMRLVGKLMGKSTIIEQLYGNLQVDSSNLKEVLDWTPPYTMQQAMAILGDPVRSVNSTSSANSVHSGKE